MPYKRLPTDGEVEGLAQRLRELWRAGEAMRPWLRRHGEMLAGLVRDEWSWQGVAAALNRASITYQTGHQWTGQRLNREFHRANRKPKRKMIQKEQRAAAAPVEPVSLYLPAKPGSDHAAREAEHKQVDLRYADRVSEADCDVMPLDQPQSEFQPVELRNWSGSPWKDRSLAAKQPQPVADPPIDVDAEIARLFGE